MEPKDSTILEKNIKHRKNLDMKKSTVLDENDARSSERLQKLFAKTENMKAVFDVKNTEVEDHFKDLRQRLNNSSGFLNHIRKSIENIKFSYQKSITDLEQVTEDNRIDVERQIEEIRKNIDKLQTREKEDQPKPQNYQEAFTDVINTFEDIAQGRYSSNTP